MPEPLLVAPAISLTVSPEAGIVPLTSATLDLQVTLHSSVKGPAKGQVHLDLPKGWTSTPNVAGLRHHAGWRGEEPHLPGEARVRAGEALHHHRGRRVQRREVHAGIQHDRLHRPASLSALPSRDLSDDGRRCEDGSRAEGRLHHGHGRRCGQVDGRHRRPRQLPFVAGHRFGQSGAIQTRSCLASGLMLHVRNSTPSTTAFSSMQRMAARSSSSTRPRSTTTTSAPIRYTLSSDPEKVIEEDNKVQILRRTIRCSTGPTKSPQADFDNWVEERGHGFMQ